MSFLLFESSVEVFLYHAFFHTEIYSNYCMYKTSYLVECLYDFTPLYIDLYSTYFVAGDCKEVIIWNLALGQQYLSINTKSEFVSDLSWNSDSSVLAITFLTHCIYLVHVHKNT